MSEKLTIEQYEVLVKRMKILSKSQTAFLKAHLSAKVTGVVSLVNKSIVALSSGKPDKAHIAELKKQLAVLKLDELNVDVALAQIEVEKELKLLRGAVGENLAGSVFGSSFSEFSSDSAPSDPFGSAPPAATNEFAEHDAARIKELEEENESLLQMVADLEEAANATGENENIEVKPVEEGSSGSGGGGIGSTSDEEVAALKDELASSKILLEKKEKEIRNQADEIAKMTKAVEGGKDSAGKMVKVLEEELLRSKQEVKDLNEKLVAKDEEMAKGVSAASEDAKKRVEKLSQETSKQHQAALEALKNELRSAFDTEKSEALEEVRNEMEKEKDEMMEALAQEVDDVEVAKNKEIEGLKTSMEEAKSAAHTAAKKLAKVQQSSAGLMNGMRSASADIAALSKEKKAIQEHTKSQLKEMQMTIRQSLGGGLLSKMKAMQADLMFMSDKYNKEYEERKKLHNQIQELKGNIRVYMRCRPPSQREIDEIGEDAVCVSYPASGEVRVMNEKNREKSWEFDEVFDFNSTQSQVYRDVSALVTSVMDGYNVCIFAYGQTGSGKTHTMAGPASDRGVNTRALEELFVKCRARSDQFQDTVTLSLLEVYNEEIRDLLVDDGSDRLEVRQGEFGNYVPGLTECPVNSIEDVFNLFAQAEKNRATASTNMNEHSSRSHMMLTINLLSENIRTGAQSRGKLNLVDLAGSERINKSGATGQALKEAQNINKSLSALGDVIAARAAKAAHIPFRNSSLSYLLQDSLSKDSKTLMICCISPTITSSEETYCSLNFAARVRTVELGKANKNVSQAKKR